MCPAGRYVSGGGASSSGDYRVLSASRPGLASEGATRDGWWVQAGYLSDDPFATDLYVMCSTRWREEKDPGCDRAGVLRVSCRRLARCGEPAEGPVAGVEPEGTAHTAHTDTAD